MSLQKAIDLFGTQADLARAIGVKPMLIYHWKKRGVPVERCAKIEEVTKGKVKRSDLRPDIFSSTKRKKPEAA